MVKHCYLVIQCQEVVVEVEGSYANCIKLGFECLAILRDTGVGEACFTLSEILDR